MSDNDIFENLEEKLFDEHIPVNIKWISNKFNVDVNRAKKIMYEFAQKKKSKVRLNVFISGELKSTKQSAMTVKQGMQFDAIDKYLKDTFSKVSSAHIQEILPLEQDAQEETDPVNLFRKIEFVENLQDKIQLHCAFAKMRNLSIEDYRKVKTEAPTSSKKLVSATKSTTPSKSIDKKPTSVDKLFSNSKNSSERESKQPETKLSSPIKEEKKAKETPKEEKTPQKSVDKISASIQRISPQKKEKDTNQTPEKKESSKSSQKKTEKKIDSKKRKRTVVDKKKDVGRGDITFDEEDEEMDETPASPASINDASESEEEESAPKEKKPKNTATIITESPKNAIDKYTTKDKPKKTRRVKKVIEEQDAKGYYISKEVWVEEEYSDEDEDIKMEESKPEQTKKSSKPAASKKSTQSIMNFFKKK